MTVETDNRLMTPMRTSLLALAAAIASLSFAQAPSGPLTLDEALRLAKEQNGTLRASLLNVQAAESGSRQARGSLLPSVTPSYEYTTSTVDQRTGLPNGRRGDAGSSLNVLASWRVFDSGERRLSIKSASIAVQQEVATARQTVRQTLFSVTRGYYEALRAQELVRVSKTQVDRAQVLLDRTIAEIEVKRAAGKDRFQPQADLLNARVSMLRAEARARTTQADLKAVLGLPFDVTGTLNLVQATDANLSPLEKDLPFYQQEALRQRPDLTAQRERLRSGQLSIRQAELSAGIQYRIDASYNRAFARDVSDRTALTLSASIPLFDGRQSKEEVKQRQILFVAGQENLRQAEREVVSEVEAIYYEYTQAALRVEAAEAALVAAQKNYDSVSAARREGIGTIVDVTVAQTTLTTAEVNRVEALYDALIAETQWKLVTGQPMTGE